MQTRAAVSLVLLFGMAFGLAACNSPQRRLAGVSDKISISKDLWSDSGEFLAAVSGPSFTAENCAEILYTVHAKLFSASATYFDVPIVDQYAGEIIQNVFKSRLKLRDRLAQFIKDGTVTPACVQGARDVMRAARFLEDYVGERLVFPGGLPPSPDKKHLPRAWSGTFPNILVNPSRPESQGVFDIRKVLRSGDLLLSRGAAFTSAAIARIGTGGSQFSHLALVYIDDGGKIFVIQAEIELGVIVVPLEQYLADGKVRSALLRFPDAELAARSAKLMYDKATAGDGHIAYNFSLEMSERDTLFCSEVINYAYELGSNGAFTVPLFQSKVGSAPPDFLAQLSVTAKQTFLPGDIEVDPRAEFIAEWRDYSRMKDTRMKDAILDKIYEWMSVRHYALQPDYKSWLLEHVIFHARRWPLFGGLLKSKFPLNMRRETLGAIGLLNDVVGALEKHLDKADARFQDKNGVSMGERDMNDELEHYRLEDEDRYPSCGSGVRENPTGKAEFHQHFRPNCS